MSLQNKIELLMIIIMIEMLMNSTIILGNRMRRLVDSAATKNCQNCHHNHDDMDQAEKYEDDHNSTSQPAEETAC